MKRELGIARCGLACCLCGESEHCAGCDSGNCPDKDRCVNRACSLEKGIAHCFDCSETDCKNEQQGVVYHREGVVGDYDGFADVEALAHFIRTGQR